MPITVIGDSTLDVTVRPAEAPRAGGDVPASISLAPGGQGANVAVRLARAGVDVRLATAIADDAPGRLLLAALEADGVTVARLPAERSGVVISMLDPTGERTMLSDRVTLDPGTLRAACEGAEWVHCSGYAMADDATGDALAQLLGSLPSTTRVSAGGGSLRDDPPLAARVRDRFATARVALFILGRDEAAALLGQHLPSLPAAADAVAGAFPATITVVTGGAAGSAAAGPGFAISVPAVEPATRVLDATGAGDAYVAAMILRLSAGGWPPEVATLREAMERGSRDGGLVSRVLGAQGRIAAEPAAR
ncbi:MAG TPA: carbohydrate kinase family protein [Methylomirabilota bacterium]|jgi:sugar/nucleoside kinase (ribokinase family)|nr:carbohydrate kinase family protein [Methylomirabilota bacterium]